MNLPAFALRNKTIVIVIALILTLNGVNVYLNAPRKEDPQFTLRDAWIITIWPGATASDVERLVADPIENALAGIEAIRRIDTTSYVGYSVTQITIQDQFSDASAAWDKVRRELTLIEPELPAGCLKPILNDHASQASVLMLCLYQDPAGKKKKKYTPRQLEDYAKALRDRIMDLRPLVKSPDGQMIPIPTAPAFVERLTLYGVQKEVIYIEADLGKWSQLALSPGKLQLLLQERNAVVPGGTIDTKDARYNVQTSGQFDAVREIQNVTVGRVAVAAGGAKVRQPVAMATQSTVGTTERQGEQSLGVLPTPLTQNVPVQLKDLDLKVVRGYADPPRSITRFSDTDQSSDCIVLAFTMKAGANIADLDEQVNALLAAANQEFLPPDIVVAKVSDQPKAVEKKVNEVISNVITSVVVVVIVLFLMAGLRIAAISTIAIGMIMLISMGLMRLWGIVLEQVSLAALIIALGILVDNTIQVCTNTQSFLDRGLSRSDAASKGPNQIAFSTLIATGTIVAAFLPLTVFLTGGMGEFAFSLPMVVCLCVVVGWLYAYTVTVIMAYYGLKKTGTEKTNPVVKKLKSLLPKNKQAAGDSSRPRQSGSYVSLCLAAIKAKWLTAGLSYGFLFLVFSLTVNPTFFPLSDKNQFVIDIWLPESAPIHRTDEVAKRVEAMVRALSERTFRDGKWVELPKDETRLVNLCALVGVGGPFNYAGLYPKEDAPNYGVVWVNVKTGPEVPQFVKDIRRAAFTGIGRLGAPDYIPPISEARIVPQQLVAGVPVKSEIDIRLLGPRLGSEEIFRKYGGRIGKAVRETGIAWDVHSSWGEYGRQIDIRLDQDKANLAGVTNVNVALSMNAYYSGHPLTTFREGDRQIPVKLRLPPSQRGSLEEIDAVHVQGITGKVPLDSVAEISRSRQPAKLQRFQRARCFSVRARPEDGYLYSQVIEAVQPELDKIQAELPPGYRIEHGGTKEEADKGAAMNMRSLAVSAVLIFVLLVAQYGSILRPLMIFLTIPLAIAGGYLGLYLQGFSLGFMETLGFLALMGIVLSAAILLIDFSDIMIRDKLRRGEGLAGKGDPAGAGLKREVFRRCLAEAGQLRFGPIMMTTLTTVGGLFTLMLLGGPLFEGLAAVIVYGLSIGTAFTLFFIPVIYAIFVENLGMKVTMDEEEPG
jgi:multidrug efflux pump subunit AcrB